MGACQLRWTALYFPLMIASSASAGISISSFLHSMFIADEPEDDQVQVHGIVETMRGDENLPSVNSVIQGQPFLLDSVLYAEFNAIGQAQFNILATKGLDSKCWREAVTSIEADCEAMTHPRKQRLAVQLNNCHLQHAGRQPTRCYIEDSDKECVEETKHDDVAFQSYTTFFHHVNAICHHLSHTLWQEQTEGLVRGLTASSLATYDRAERSLEKQELVLRGQELATEQGREIAHGLNEASVRLNGLSDSLSTELTATLSEIAKQEAVLANLARVQDDAAEQASHVLHELGSAKSELSSYMEAIEADRRATMDQNMALADTIGFIHDCLANASSAWARFQSFTYLILAVNLCWVLTTPAPLRPARTTLFALVALGLLLEKCLCEDADRAGTVSLPEWIVSGLEMATRGTFTTATWTRVFLQEKIRWVTFQVGAAVLAHTLLAHCFPCLTLGRLVGLLRGRREGKNASTDGEIEDIDSLNGKSARTSPLGSGSNGGRMREIGHEGGRLVTPLTLRLPPDGGLSVVDGGGIHGRDELEDLSRKELQALAKATCGLVKANQSTQKIIEGLRDAGY